MNDVPVVSAIAEQVIDEDSVFPQINLSDYVDDVETVDEDIIWSYSGDTDLSVDITEQVATIGILADNWNGTEMITFTATDTGDGGTPSLSDSVDVTFTVNPVNDAPVASGSASLLAIDEDNTSSVGSTVSDLFGGNFDDSTDDVEDGSSANTLAGIAIKGDSSTSDEGAWQHSTDSGNSWSDLPNVTSGNAFVLSDVSLLRFNPASDWNGTPGDLEIHLIDDSQGSVTSGTTVDVSTDIGGTTPYSLSSVSLGTVVNPVNDVPEITYFFPEQDTLIYTNIHGEGQAEADVYVYDFDSDNLTFQWMEQDTLINGTSLEIPASDTLKINFNFYFDYGEHPVTLTVTDDGEYHDTDTTLFDTTQQIVTDSTLFKVGQPSILTVSNQVFVINDVDRFFSPVTIANGLIDSTINISNGLRMCLPQYSTIKWTESGSINVDPTKLTFNSISEDSTQLVFHVESDFLASESVEISGLKVTGFDSIMNLNQIRVIADDRTEYSSANAQDQFGFWVGSPTIKVNPEKLSDNFLLVNSLVPDSVWRSEIVLENGPIDSTFHKGDTLRIKIHNYLNMDWSIEAFAYDTTKFSYIDISNKILKMKIVENFLTDSNESIEVGFKSLESSEFHSLFLDVVGTDAGGIGPSYPDSTLQKLTVGDPSLASDTSQVFVVNDTTQVLQPIRYMEDGMSPTLEGHPHIYLKIPDEMHVFWAQSLTGDSVQVTDQTGDFIPINSFELLNSTVLYIDLNIDSSWTEHDTIVISNLKIDGFEFPTEGPVSFLLSVLDSSNYHDEDTNSVQIGRPRLALTQNNTFLYNDVASVIRDIIIYEDSLVTTITKEEGILLMLPEGFSGQWVIPENWMIPDSLNTNGSYDKNNIDSLVIISPDTLKLVLSQDFDSQDSLIIYNLMVGEFNNTSYESNSLKLSVNGETTNFPHYQTDNTNWLKIGRPDIEMEYVDILLGNDNSVLLPPINITEDLYAPVIDSSRGFITLILPKNTGIEWDTSIPIVELGGTAGSRVSPIPDYDSNMVSFEIKESFSIGDSVSIYGLYLMPPSDLVDSALIALSLNGGTTDCDSTSKKIRVGILTFSSEEDQFFFKNSDDRKLSDITISQDTSVSLIDSLLVLVIPDSLMAEWDSSYISIHMNVFVNGDTNNPIQEPDIQYSDSHKKIYIVSSMFDSAEYITITKLYFKGLDSPLLDTSSEDTLRLILDDLTYSFVLTDSFRKIIGGPSIYSLDNSSFVLGESGIYAQIDTIILREDETVFVLSEFDSLKIVISDDASSFFWDTTSSVYLGSSTIPVNYQNSNKIASFPLVISDPMVLGDTMKLWGLGFDSITIADTGFYLEFQLVREGTVPTIQDTARISSGTLSIDLENSIDYPLGTSLSFELPEITIGEHTTNLLGEKRALVLVLSEELRSLANWQLNDQPNDSEIDHITVIEDTLKVFFNKELSNHGITLSDLELTTSEIYGDSAEVQADSLASYFTLESGVIELSTHRLDVGYSPMVLDVSTETVEFYPPVLLAKPEIYNQLDTTVISFPSSPGMFHPDSIFLPSMFQIIRTPWLASDDTTLFSDESSIVNIENSNWIFSDSITVLNMPFVRISLSEEDLVRLNLWFDGMHYYDESFEHFLDVDKTTLPFTQSSIDVADRITDSSSISWTYYNPDNIFFNSKERIISNDELTEFVLYLGDVFPDSVQIRLRGEMTNLDSTILLYNTDSTFSLSGFSNLGEDLYTIWIESQNTSNNGMVPVIRQFIVDNTQPQLVDILPRTGISKLGGGHEVSKSEKIVLFYQEDLSIIRDSLNYLIQFSQDDTVLNTEFPFPDSLELSLRINWSENLSYNNSDLNSFYVARTQSDVLNWSMQLDSVLSFLVEDDSLIAGLESMNARIVFTLSDYTINTDVDSVEYTILLDIDRLLGTEVFNYPNPFSVAKGERTHIRYVINREGHNTGKFIVFDAGGDVVHYNNEIDVSLGTHSEDLIWDGTDLRGNKLASGIYFGFLQIENEKPVRIKIAILNR